MHGLSYSRSDKVICCSFLTRDAIKFVHCVNRVERPLPSNYFKYHHYLLCFSALLWSVSLCIIEMAQSQQRHFFPSAAVSSNASAGISLTALIFSTSVLPPFSPAVADSKPSDHALIMLSVHWVSVQSVCNQLQAHCWQEKPRAFTWIALALILTTLHGKKDWFCSVLHGDILLLRSIHADELAALCRVWLVSPPASPLFMNHQMLCQQLCDGCIEPQRWCFVKYNLSFVPIEVQIWWIRRIYCSQRLAVERVNIPWKK